MHDTIDLILLDDGNVEDLHQWLKEALEDEGEDEEEEDEENAQVFKGEYLTWGHVVKATGAAEATYSRRSRGGVRKTDNHGKKGAKTTTSSSRSKKTMLVDEDDFDVETEENDVASYKDFHSGRTRLQLSRMKHPERMNHGRIAPSAVWVNYRMNNQTNGVADPKNGIRPNGW
ncbi:hypothetical protein E3N88_00042 [Mikania micrantha]|uniref:Uncharacterized protein n=1 Tax=Mikania micrantha TaxID=192012 RepID=A0A5N6PYR7_9ASTR|nr:hypothetical protein E3N88_00042 [Mikania micrantha]